MLIGNFPDSWGTLRIIHYFMIIFLGELLFLIPSAIYLRAFKKRKELVAKDIMSIEDGNDLIPFFVYISFGIVPAYLSYTSFLNNGMIIGSINLILVLLAYYFFYTVAFKKVKMIKHVIKFPVIIFESKICTIMFNPIYLIIIILILLSLTRLYY